MNIIEKRISIKVLVILAVVMLVVGLAQTSFAALTVSRNTDGTVQVDPVDGFPLFYQDAAGVPLTLCLDQVPAGICFLPPITPPVTFPGNFPEEVFYYFAESRMSAGELLTNTAVIRFMLEGAFAAGPASAGDQMTFLRIRLLQLQGLTPGGTYNVIHPYGSFQVSADQFGRASETIQDGCDFVPCDFPALLPATRTGMDTFLQWAPPAVPPVGYIGNSTVARRVVGGPNGNVFRIDGPNIGGFGVNTKQTPLFFLAGKLATPFSIQGFVRNPDGTRAAGVTVTLSGDAAATTTTNANGVFVFRDLANGNYTVTPSRPGYTCLPVSRAVTVNGADVTGVTFDSTTTTFSIRGVVRNAAGVGLGGITVRLGGAAVAARTTAANGTYIFTGLANGVYTVTPSQPRRTITTALSGAQEVPPVTTAGSGTARLTVNTITRAISGTVTFTGLNSNSTAAHIHQAAAGVNGAIIVPMVGGAGATAGTWTIPAGSVLTPAQMTALRANGLYFNVHSLTSSAGEIRGQIIFPTVTFTPVRRTVTINGANVIGVNFRRN